MLVFGLSADWRDNLNSTKAMQRIRAIVSTHHGA